MPYVIEFFFGKARIRMCVKANQPLDWNYSSCQKDLKKETNLVELL
jgi:hypothetical protein